MMRCLLIPVLFLFAPYYSLKAQTCTALGQNPQTAFPVCGTAVFSQNSVAICGDRAVASRCTDFTYTDKNPYWYKFTCFSAGTLGFVITPNTLTDDYDWQLFDITNRDPTDVYTDVSLFVACNWSADGGLTGASPAGTSFVRCQGPGVPLFSTMPNLILGHEYILLVSHFTDSQSGYSLSFGGGSASITDPLEPHLLSAEAACDGTAVTVKLNKKMKCVTLAGNGTDFIISSGGNFIAASAVSCATGFDMDVVSLTLSSPLPPGSYTISIQNGSDANTLKDNCDRSVPVGESIPLTVFPIQPTPMDSLTKPVCSPQTLELVFRKPIRCSSIAANGTDFVVTGTYPVTVTAASGNCTNGVTSKIFVQLSAPLLRAGNFVIRLVTGTDGNTIIDECGQETPAGETQAFTTKDTVNADFSYNISLGCDFDTIQYLHPPGNGVNSWQWSFDNGQTSILQNPQIFYSVFGQQETQLIVSNGTCSDTASASILLTNTLKAQFEATTLVCPDDPASFKDHSIGDIVGWSWDFQNGNTSILPSPPPQTYIPAITNYYVPVQLIVENDIGCFDTATVTIMIINNCYIAVPSAFTPNSDGLNDFLYPLNAYKATNLSFSVYNRFGQRVFYTEDWTHKWDGRFKGQGADPGTYVWILQFFNTETNKRVEQKGTTVLIR